MFIINLNEQKTMDDINNLFIGNFENSLIKYGKFSDYSPVYAFTTENIRGYLPKLNIKGGSALTVCGSGDHIINSFLCGADEVYAFDINILSAFIADLKITALKKLSYKEFFKFFMIQNSKNSENSSAFNFETYASLREELNSITKTFFEKVYELNNYNGSNVRKSTVFNNLYDTNNLKIMSNIYLQSEVIYNEAKQNIQNKNIFWMHSDILNLNRMLQKSKKFNVILLSNISDYAKNMFSNQNDYIEQFVESAVKPLAEYLSTDGEICAAYVYDASEKAAYRTDMDNPKLRQSAFSKLNINYKELYFESVMLGKKDMVVVLKR